MIRTSSLFIASIFASTAALSAPLSSGNIVVSSQNTISEYSLGGQLIQSFPTVYPGGYPGTEYARDVVLDGAGKAYVYNGTFYPYLSTYNTTNQTWSHQTYSGFSTVNNGSYGGIGIYGQTVFATDMFTYSGGEAQGIVAFSNGTAQRFAQNIQPIDLTVGLNGLLYALTGSTVYVYDPSTYAALNTVSLSAITGSSDHRSIAVDANGHIFVADWNGGVFHLDQAGAVLGSTFPTCTWIGSPIRCEFDDIDVSQDGRIVLGTRFGEVFVTDSAFSSISTFRPSTQDAFVAFVPPPPLSAPNVAADGQEDTTTPITLSATGGSGTYSYQILTSPGNGTLNGTAPNLTYTPLLNFFGTDSFTYQVNDGKSVSNIATVTIAVQAVNDAPMAANQSVTTNEDTALAVGLSATDIDSPSLQYSVVAGPTNGMLSGTAPNLVYTPAANYHGADSFTFKASDGNLDSNVATVSITVVATNNAPVANADSATTRRNRSVTIYVLANDTDADGDDLMVSAVTKPANGYATITGDMKKVKYTPKERFVGVDSFTYTISDGKGGTATAVVTVTVKKS